MSGLSESVTAAAAKVLSADSSGEGAAEEGSPAAQPEYEYGYGSNGLTKEEEDMSDAERISYLREVRDLSTGSLHPLSSWTEDHPTLTSHDIRALPFDAPFCPNAARYSN